MAKHTTWARSRFSDPERVRIVQFEGRKLLGGLMEQLKRDGQTFGVRRKTLADGTLIIARFDGTTPLIQVHAPPGQPALPTKPGDKAGVWVPRGFVLYPISDESINGWGVPSIDIDPDDPYSEINRVPGLDVERWTAGGALGEVLLTTVPGAGYPPNEPESLVAPMFCHATAGLRNTLPIPERADEWAAYRLEFEDFTAQSPGADAELQLRARNWKRSMFELTNAYRADIGGLDPLLLPIRGHYDSAQATSEVMAASQTIGHESPTYAATYKWRDDRGSKDGVGLTGLFYFGPAKRINVGGQILSAGENLAANTNGTVEVIGEDYTGLDIVISPSGPQKSPEYVFDLWVASPPHESNISSTEWNPSPPYTNYSTATSLAIGLKRSYYTQHFILRSHWVPAGNMTWHPTDPNLPIVSWDGFNQLNLAWETFPVWFFPDLDDFTAQMYKYEDFTVTADPANVGQHPFIRGDLPVASGITDRRARLNLSPRIFMRGRCVAIAPNGGLVWAAAIQARPAEAGVPVYRLVALVHHSEDQAEVPEYPAAITDGMTSVLRVWYVDIPQVLPDFAANAQSVIRGVFGDANPDGPWDWEDVNAPYKWRGGVEVNVSDSMTLLKYASQWRFNPAGTKVVCLRDYGTVAELEEEYLSQPSPPGAFYDLISYPDYSTSGQMANITGGRWVKYLELDVTDATAPTLYVSPVNVGALPHKMATTYVSFDGFEATTAAWIRPAAVDYDASGNLIFAHHVIGGYNGVYAVPAGTLSQQRHGMYFSSNWDVTWHTAAPAAIWYSAVIALPGEDLMGTLASVIDVRDKVWAHIGTACSAVDTGENPANPGNADYPLYVDFSPDSIYRICDFTADCLACVRVPESYTLRMYRDGVMILDVTTDNGANVVHDFRLFPSIDHRFVPRQINPALQASYARDETGEWVATLAHIPQVRTTFLYVPSGTIDTSNTHVWTLGNECFNACGEGIWLGTPGSLFTSGLGNLRNLGGSMTSSFANAAELAELMQVPGDNPRSPYVRIV